METSIHAFFFHGDGTIEPISPTVIHDHRADRVRLPTLAGERLRYAIVRVDIPEREILHLTLIWCGILYFDEQGRQDQRLIKQQHNLMAEALLGSFRAPHGKPTGRVVDARAHFAQRQLNHRYAWTPTEKDLQEIRRLVENQRQGEAQLKLLS